jgi:predicted PurR-regulated permease PerM
MNSKIIANGILRAIGILGLFVIGIWFLFSIRILFVYLILALLLSMICNPIVEFLKKKTKFNTFWAVTTTLFILILSIISFVLLFVPLITAQIQSLSLLNTADIEQKVIFLYEQFSSYLAQNNIDIQEAFNEFNLSQYINITFLPSFLNRLLETFSSIGIGIATVLFITFFFLKDQLTFITAFKKIIPISHEEETLKSIQKINEMLTRYFVGLLIQLFIVFVLYFIVLLILGIENAFVIALLCAILNIIPYVGPLIGSILAATLTMISMIGGDFQTEILPTTIYVLIGFFIVQLIDNNVNQPIIFSKSTQSHPIEIFLVIIIAGMISGIVGMIIAVPLYTMLKVVAKAFFPENKLVQVFTRKI